MVTPRKVKVALPSGANRISGPAGQFLALLSHQHQAALFRPDRELPAQRGLVREDEPAVQRAAGFGLVLINANGKQGLLVDHTIEPMKPCSLHAGAGK